MLSESMAIVGSMRKLLIVLLVAAQPTSAAFAATMPAILAPCPIHSGVLPVQASDASPHQHATAGHEAHATHGVPAESPAQSDEGQTYPAAFSFACCAAHVVGVLAHAFPIPTADWLSQPVAAIEPALEPGELSSVDPPPRGLL